MVLGHVARLALPAMVALVALSSACAGNGDDVTSRTGDSTAPRTEKPTSTTASEPRAQRAPTTLACEVLTALYAGAEIYDESDLGGGMSSCQVVIDGKYDNLAVGPATSGPVRDPEATMVDAPSCRGGQMVTYPETHGAGAQSANGKYEFNTGNSDTPMPRIIQNVEQICRLLANR